MQVLVIGAGLVGLAASRALTRRGADVVVAEKAAAIGTGTSSRNSEVIHGGMYYPTGTLRARHSVAGRRMLYAYCASHGVPCRKLGKLVVAADAAETAKIEAIARQGGINGVEELVLIDGRAARAMEPELVCAAALHSPETGIIDSHRYMLALRGDLEDAGGMIAFNTRVEGIERRDGRWHARFGGAEPPAGTRVIPLQVAGAFHTRYMGPAVETLRAAASEVAASDPRITVWSNRDGAAVDSGRAFVDLLVDQVASPVRWDLCMASFATAGVSGIVELSPAGTLTGLAKRALRGTPAVAVKTPDDLVAAGALISGENS